MPIGRRATILRLSGSTCSTGWRLKCHHAVELSSTPWSEAHDAGSGSLIVATRRVRSAAFSVKKPVSGSLARRRASSPRKSWRNAPAPRASGTAIRQSEPSTRSQRPASTRLPLITARSPGAAMKVTGNFPSPISAAVSSSGRSSR